MSNTINLKPVGNRTALIRRFAIHRSRSIILVQLHRGTWMVDAFSCTQPGDLVVLPEERRQLQRLQMADELDLRCVDHTVPPVNRSMCDRADVVATVALSKYG
jgi:hypothetical protein